MKAVIINYNRLTLTKQTADWLSAHGLDVVIIDNHSDYKPLDDWYKSCPYKVLIMDKNYGHKVLWEQWLFRDLDITDKYILTDPDLDLTNIPDDFLDVMSNGLEKYPSYDRIGVSLEIDDLPNDDFSRKVYKWELQWWNKPLDNLYFDAQVDTTLAMHKVTNYNTFNSLRIGRPYTARHLPWYYTDFEKLPNDELYYLQTAGGSISWRRNPDGEEANKQETITQIDNE